MPSVYDLYQGEIVGESQQISNCRMSIQFIDDIDSLDEDRKNMRVQNQLECKFLFKIYTHQAFIIIAFLKWLLFISVEYNGIFKNLSRKLWILISFSSNSQ